MATLYISGDGNPSPNGYYPYAGEHEGEPYYQRQDAAFVVFRAAVPMYIIATALSEPTDFWARLAAQGKVGSYGPSGSYTGNPVVAMVPVGAGNLLGVGL